MDEDTLLEFDYESGNPIIIKVIGVGGGGGNAVSHMYEEGIHDVSFVLCNTDRQALDRSNVPDKIILGKKITQGLGAGNKPERARLAAEESADELRNMLTDGTKMVFITAGMGGGTGTGAAPVIAQVARDMGLLTVGIVTIPFLFEGEKKIIQALNGVEEIAKSVDALLVINNEKLRDIYADLTVMNAFRRADDTLTTAAKSIAEIITMPGIINLDFADVKTTMKDGGVALMSNGFGEGDERVRLALEDALNSPLLGNKNVKNAKRVLLNVYFSQDNELLMEEMTYIHEFMAEANRYVEVIWGTAIDNTLGNKVKITILATGFTMEDIPQIAEKRMREAEEETGSQEDRLAKEREERELIAKYYGPDAKGGKLIQRAHIVVLTDNELDNDAMISLLEDKPPYNRDAKLVAQLRAKAKVEEPAGFLFEQPAGKESASEGDSPVISFFN
ncbi:cell division protein FtsZ [Parabacteroides sp. PFB2-10]|uniref:cell division protein FtsZ n=1 Tax=Parabacteroides sp. PFB2-10 TaxID=1742405 RepID=UPI00247556BD|nr:cell division protein FtsZ [Parabacteroides sp. PFB2-10]MDH6312879.1 cell division protein FtsZ [Parabacteroides sp. PFB2-10]